MIHYVKCHPGPFQAVWDGLKPSELRKDDRDPPYAVGDTLFQQEWDPETASYSGRAVEARITDIRRETKWGLQPGYAMLGLGPISRYHAELPVVRAELEAVNEVAQELQKTVHRLATERDAYHRALWQSLYAKHRQAGAGPSAGDRATADLALIHEAAGLPASPAVGAKEGGA